MSQKNSLFAVLETRDEDGAIMSIRPYKAAFPKKGNTFALSCCTLSHNIHLTILYSNKYFIST